MTQDLENKLKSRWASFTPSEQGIASYLLNHLDVIPFETAASLSALIGVSPMTVSRFLRSLGYRGLGELKQELRHDAPWLKLYKKRALPEGSDLVSQSLHAEIKTLESVYALAKTPEWQAIVHKIAASERLVVASFQLAGFIAYGLVSLLQHVKPNTVLADGTDGAYIEALLDIGRNDCVILIDFRRYSRHFRVLAEEAARRKIPLIIITDVQCHWARTFTNDVLLMPIDADRLWHSYGSVFALLSLLIEMVILELGGGYERIEEITALRHKFIGYSGPATSGHKRKTSAHTGRRISR